MGYRKKQRTTEFLMAVTIFMLILFVLASSKYWYFWKALGLFWLSGMPVMTRLLVAMSEKVKEFWYIAIPVIAGLLLFEFLIKEQKIKRILYLIIIGLTFLIEILMLLALPIIYD